MNKYFTYIYIIAKNSYSTKKKLIFQMLNHIIFLLFNFFLYQNLYKIKPELVDKIPFQNAIWSMSMYFVIFWLGTRRLSRIFKGDIESGNIEIYLLRPMNYIKQKVLQITGQNIYPFLLALITSVVISFYLVGLPVIYGNKYFFLIQLFVILIFSQILMYLLYIFCGLIAFWMNDNTPIENLFGKFIMILGGAWVPVAFFPLVIQKVAYYSPFGVSASLSLAMYPDSISSFNRNMFVIMFWIIVFGLINYFTYKLAVKKISVNG